MTDICNSQTATWAANTGTNTFNTAYKTTKTSNAVYVCGSVNGNIHFAKYGLNGGLIWSQTIVCSASQTADIEVSAGYVYVTGFFKGANINFDPAGNFLLSSNNNSFDIFLGKYKDNDGSFSDAKAFGGPTTDFAKAIEIDAAQNIYLLGYFTSTVNFNLNGGTANLINNDALNPDLFLIKYSQPGAGLYNIQWMTAIQGAPNDINSISGYGLGIDEVSGNAYITGTFSGDNISFNPSVGDHILSASGSFDAFVASYSGLTGNCIQAGVISSPYADQGNDISVYGANLYVTGSVSTNVSGIASVNFNLKGGTDNVNTVGGKGDVFVAAYNTADLSYQWGYIFGSANVSGIEAGYGVKATGNGIFVTGSFFGNVDFNPGSQTNNLVSAGNTDVFILRLTAQGSYGGSFRVGGASADIGYSTDADDAGNFYICGTFAGANIDFDPGNGTLPMTGLQSDLFLAGYNSGNVLPSIGIQISAVEADERVLLHWSNPNEKNIRVYRIERYDHNWETIGYVNADTVASHVYSFTDIPKTSGNLLYRIRSELKDGNTFLSAAVKVYFGKKEPLLIVFPNPTTELIFLQYHLKKKEKVVLTITNNSGTVLKRFVNDHDEGTYSISFYVTDLKKGIYYCSIYAEEKTETRRFSIQ